MLPLLERLEGGRERRISDLYDETALVLNLDREDRSELLASGRQSRFENRVGWAKTYLTKAGLLDSPRRGVARITPRGLEVLHEKPSRVDISFLRQYEEFVAFKQAPQQAGVPESAKSSEESPEELLDNAFSQLKAELTQSLIQEIRAAAPSRFERLVVDLLLKMGYGGPSNEGWVVGGPGDEGIDGIINEDKLGLDVIYVQAKRWEGTVGRRTVQEFTGSLEGQRASKGVLITTSKFSAEAQDFISKIGKKVVLVEGSKLAELLIEQRLGVETVNTYDVMKVDRDYFAGEGASAAD